jgi:hypothetical protein
MMDDRIGAPDLDVLQEMRRELLLQIKQSRETIGDSEDLLRRVNAQINRAPIARTTRVNLRERPGRQLSRY